MGEISASGCPEVEKIKQILMDEFKIHQRLIRSTAVEYQALLKKTAVKLTSGLDSVYKEKFQYLDEVAAKIASGDDVEKILSKESVSSFLTTYDFNLAQLKTAIENWSVSPSNGCTDSCVPMSTPSFEAGTEVRVDVGSGITKQGIFWLYLQELPESNQLALADLYKRISLEMLRDKEWKSFEESKSSPEVGDYVLVDAWNGWARGKIEKLKDDNTFAVRLVDYGELISCGTGLLRSMKSDLYPDTDYQALRCCLSLDGDPLDLPIEAVWVFNDLLRENFAVKNPVICIFKNKILGKDSEEICQVDLMVKDKKGNSVSISQAVNKKIEDKAKGRDSIACRDIRYSAKECTGSRYIERPAESNGSQKSSVTVIEKPAETENPRPSEEQQDTASSGKGFHGLMPEEQSAGEKEEPVLSENSTPIMDGFICVAENNSVTDSLHPVSSPCQSAVSEENPETHDLLNEQAFLPSTIPSAFPLDLQILPCVELSSSPPVVVSEAYAAPVEKKHSTLKPDAVPFVSHSQTNLDFLAKPVHLLTDNPVLYRPENFSDFVPQEQSVMEMHPYFGPAMNLQGHFPNYAGAKPLEFGGNMTHVMPGMIYQNQEPTYSYVPPMFNATCIPTYPAQEEVGHSSYSRQETFVSEVQASEGNFEEPRKVDHLMPTVCSTNGGKFLGLVTSQMEADGTFWMQLARNEQKEVDAWNRMQATLSTCNKLTLPIASEEVVPGLMAIVPSSQSGELYRAEVLSIKDRKAVQCCLYCPSSDGGQCFDQTARKLFDNLVKGATMMATVMFFEPGNPETRVVKLHDSFGRNVLDEMAQSHFSQRLCSRDDSGLMLQQNPGALAASGSLSDTAAMSSAAPLFPLNQSQQSSSWCEPVKKLMASVRNVPSSLADVAQAALPLRNLTYDLSIPPPSMLPPSMISQMSDAGNRMMLAQNFTPSSDAQNEWNNQQTRMESQTNPPLETSAEVPKDRNGQFRRGPCQQRYGDDEQRSTPPLNTWIDSNVHRQQSADDDRAKLDRKNFGCFNCGEIGHKRNACPNPPHSKKPQIHGAYGRTNSKK